MCIRDRAQPKPIEAAGAPHPDPAPQTLAQAAASDPWAPLLEAGLNWLATLAEPPAQGAAPPATGPRITTDPATGQRHLSLPLPDPATVQMLAKGLEGLLARLRT